MPIQVFEERGPWEMDFSYFNSAPQPYQVFGLPSTPAGSTTPQADEYHAAASPVRTVKHYKSIDWADEQEQDQYDAAFAQFQQSFHYDPSTFLAQPHSLAPHSPQKSTRTDSLISMPDANNSSIYPPATDLTPEDQTRARSSSEEKESLTPAQSRRKAQNRAAYVQFCGDRNGALLFRHEVTDTVEIIRQRAFRERKEKHVKELEAKLTTLEQKSASLNGENERLRRELAKYATENEILRAASGGNTDASHPFLNESDPITGPMRYSPTDFVSKSVSSTSSESSPDGNSFAALAFKHGAGLRGLGHRRIVADDSGEALLAAGATWDYIQAHELYRKGLVDVGDVCERLKKVARCDGQGPVFEEGDIRRAIAESAVAGGKDELI